MLPQNFFIFILFYDFYRKAYNKKSKVNENGAKTALNNDVDEENDSKYVDLLKKKKKLNEDFNDEKINAWVEPESPIVLSSYSSVHLPDGH